MRKKAGKALLYFCVLMLCCTVIARAASAAAMAKVETVKVGKGVLTQTVGGSGSVIYKEQNSQSLPEGQKIKDILVKPQTAVQKGDALLQLDLEYLAEKIQEQGREIEKLELELKKQEAAGQADARIPETAQARIALDAAAGTLDQAQAAYDQAVAEYNQLADNPPADGEEQQWEQEVEAAWQKTESTADAVDSQTIAYNQAVEQYNLAEENEANARQNQEKNDKANAISRQSAQVDIDGAEEKLKKLTDIQGKQGIVSADTSGIFQSARAAEGALTTGTEQIMIASGETEAKGLIAAKDAGKIAEGDKIDVVLPGESNPVQVKVSRLEQISAAESGGEDASQGEEPGTVAWYGDLENKDGRAAAGAAFTYESNKESGAYEQIVPLSAVHSEQGTSYVLSAEVRDGILGKVYTAVRVPVTILAKDNDKAAVKIILDRETPVISSSSKYVEEGDSVRLK